MRSAPFLTLVTFLTAGGIACADAPGKHDPSGTWVWTSQVDDQTIENRLTVILNGKRLRGTYSNQGVRQKIQNPEFDGETMTFDLAFQFDDTDVTAGFSGKVTGDRLTGSAALSLNGQEETIPVSAQRKTRVTDVTGAWTLAIETSDGEQFSPTVTIVAEKGKLSGTYKGPVAGTHDLKEIKLKKNVLTFQLAGDAESDASTFSAKFTGTPRGNQMEGEADLVINGIEGTATITGTRTPARSGGKKKKSADGSKQ